MGKIKGIMLEDLVAKDRPYLNSSLYIISNLLTICCKTDDEVCVPHFDTQMTYLIQKRIIVDNEIGDHKLKRALYEMIDRLDSMNLSISFGCCSDPTITNIILGKLDRMAKDNADKIPTDHMRIAADRASLGKRLELALGDCVFDQLDGFLPGAMHPNIMDGHFKIVQEEEETTTVNTPFIYINGNIIVTIDINKYLEETVGGGKIRIPEFFLAIRKIRDRLRQCDSRSVIKLHIPKIDVQLQKVYYQHIDTTKDLLKEKFDIYGFLPESRTGEEIDDFFRQYAIETANVDLKDELLMFLNASNSDIIYSFGGCGDTVIRDAFINTFEYMIRQGCTTGADITHVGNDIILDERLVEYPGRIRQVSSDKANLTSTINLENANGRTTLAWLNDEDLIAGTIFIDFRSDDQPIQVDLTKPSYLAEESIDKITHLIESAFDRIPDADTIKLPNIPGLSNYSVVLVGWDGLDDLVDQIEYDKREELKQAGYTSMETRFEWKISLRDRIGRTVRMISINALAGRNLHLHPFSTN